MTTIIAVETENDITWAWDSQVTMGQWGRETEYSKVFANGEFVVGLAGLLRIGQILEATSLPHPDSALSGDKLDTWMTRAFVPTLRELLKSEEALSSENGMASSDSYILVGIRGRVYSVGADFSWLRYPDGVYTVGSGDKFARGALAHGASAEDALRIASNLDIYTGATLHTAKSSEILSED